jgi:Protein of unknown function DUF72
VSSIEINGSFYSLQRPESYRAWYEATPEGFVFSIKGSLSAKGAGWLADAESASRPASCERTHILQQSDRRQQSFGLDAASWHFATRPSPNKKAACSPKRVKLPGNQHGLHRRKPSMVEIRQLVGCVPLPAIGPGPRRGLARHPPSTADANDRHDCINPYTSRSRLFLVVSALGRRPWRSNTHLRCG